MREASAAAEEEAGEERGIGEASRIYHPHGELVVKRRVGNYA